MAEVYASGVSVAETGRLLGLHHTTVLYGLRQLGIERRKRPAPAADARREYREAERAARAIRDAEICDLYGKGFSAVDIGKRLGVTGMLVYGVIKRKGLPPRPHGGPRVRLPSGPRQPTPTLYGHKFVNYADYREEWRDARNAERILQILDRRRTRLCA